MDPGGDSAEREVNDKRRNRLGRCRESGRCSNNGTSQFGLVFSPSHSPGSCVLFFKGSLAQAAASNWFLLTQSAHSDLYCPT